MRWEEGNELQEYARNMLWPAPKTYLDICSEEQCKASEINSQGISHLQEVQGVSESLLCHCYITLLGLSSPSATLVTPNLYHYLFLEHIHNLGICFYRTVSTYPCLTGNFVLLFHVSRHRHLINFLVFFFLTPIIFLWILIICVPFSYPNHYSFFQFN